MAMFAAQVDPKIVQVDNLGYDTLATIYFQRTTVIVSELVLYWALQRMLTVMGNRPLQKIINWSLILNPGLLMVDNMHFQYNGFLYGILVHSLVDAKQVPRKTHRNFMAVYSLDEIATDRDIFDLLSLGQVAAIRNPVCRVVELQAYLPLHRAILLRIFTARLLL